MADHHIDAVATPRRLISKVDLDKFSCAVSTTLLWPLLHCSFAYSRAWNDEPFAIRVSYAPGGLHYALAERS